MRLRAALLALLLLPAAPAPAAAPAATRTFTDQFGRTLVGEIVEAGVAQVKIRRDNGQVISLELAQLSDADAAYVAQWRHDHVRIQLRIAAAPFRTTLGTIPQRDDGPATRRLAAGYDLKLTNDSPDPADSLRVEYAVFQLNADGSLTRTVGSVQPAPLPFKQSLALRTTPVQFSQTLSPDGSVASASHVGDLAGVWVRVLRDDKVVAELVTSDRVKAEGWPSPSRPPPPASVAATRHTFTDQFGHTFTGEIVEADDTQAKIRRDDGQVFDLEVAKLSADDDAYVARWRLDHLKFDLRVETDTFHETVGANRSTNASTVSQNMAAGYNLKVTNLARAPAAGLRLEYNVFVFRSGPGAPSGRVTGFAALDPLALKQTATVRTQPVTYTKTVAMRGTATQTVELRGVWARVLFDGRLVAEFLSAEKLRAEGWQDLTSPGRGRRGGAGGGFGQPPGNPPRGN